MTHLGDSLRNLADRAPIEETTVSVAAAARRVQRGRRLRVAANVTAGAGAAAVVALAAIQPNFTSASDDAAREYPPAAAEDAKADGALMGSAEASGIAPQPAELSSWGACGTRPLEETVPYTSRGDGLTFDTSDAVWTPGVDAKLPATFTPVSSGDIELAPPVAMVLWNGYVVATTVGEDYTFTTQSASEGQAIEHELVASMGNCWDGADLPAGSYQLLAYQDVQDVVEVAVPTAEPQVDPVVKPSSGPSVAPSASPDAPASQAAAEPGVVASTEPGLAPEVVPAPIDPAPIVATGYYRTLSEVADFTIEGDVPSDPFGQYLSGGGVAVDVPEDLMTPAQARTEFARRVAPTAWDMAPGTQRVVKQNDSAVMNNEDSWNKNYYGCSWDGQTSARFPAESAVWPLLDVEASLPARAELSHGWVIDDNPQFNLTISNVSGYSLPGFYGNGNSVLYLVKDGVVVAESYPAAVDPSSVNYSGDGFLAADGTLSSDFLWRDVNGCWSGDAATLVEPGTYTVLNMQSVYLDANSYGPIFLQEAASSAVTDQAVADTAPAPGAMNSVQELIDPGTPVVQDWLELQVWTSLGEVTLR